MGKHSRVCPLCIKHRAIFWLYFILISLPGVLNLKGRFSTSSSWHMRKIYYDPRGRYQQGAKCPVMPPCFCDGMAARSIGIKKLVCGEVGNNFPTFLFTPEVVDSLTLMYTGLRRIPAGGFSKLHVINIDLQGNNFGDNIDVHAFAQACRSLQALNMAWSNISALPAKVFRGMINLRNFSLAENRIFHLPSVIFQDMRSLNRLSLSGNPIRTLSQSIFRYQTNLQFLDLGYCNIHSVTGVFMGLWHLRRLDLRGNAIHVIKNGVFEDLWSLGTLLLSHNPIRRLQTGAFRGLHNLERLELKESSLEYLSPGVFSETSRLRTLELANNRLTVIDPGVLTIPTLEWLSLDGNYLHHMPADVAGMKQLVYLDISYNRLTHLDRCLFKDLDSLRFLNLRQNPWWCTCALFWLRTLQMRLINQWEKDRMIPFVPGTCSHPYPLHGVGLTNWIDIDCLRESNFRYDCR